MNYAVTIAFDGTAYCGWQVQNNAISIQQTVQDAAEKVFGMRPPVTGCSRTDSGVHAREYVCVISDVKDIKTEAVPLALNACLPADISALKARRVPDDFHPRYDCIQKEYEYVIWNSNIKNVFDSRVWHLPRPLDTERMASLAQDFVGKQDFCSYMSAGSKIIDTVRTVKYMNVTRDGDYIRINVAADGFLYNMVRIMTGTLVEATYGKKCTDIRGITEAKDRSKAGMTAPACGLFLNKLVYTR
ncbi:MAG: tRNA pseudouridine(38-40) synthase TruA [Clostridia bacterium]|nr:tRNA pseudouridine(38-40) synthase TruA [Clostridia bacterium]